MSLKNNSIITLCSLSWTYMKLNYINSYLRGSCGLLTMSNKIVSKNWKHRIKSTKIFHFGISLPICVTTDSYQVTNMWHRASYVTSAVNRTTSNGSFNWKSTTWTETLPFETFNLYEIRNWLEVSDWHSIHIQTSWDYKKEKLSSQNFKQTKWAAEWE